MVESRWQTSASWVRDARYTPLVCSWLSCKYPELARFTPNKKGFGPTFSGPLVDQLLNELFEEFPNITASARWTGLIQFLFVGGYRDRMPRWMRVRRRDLVPRVV